MRYFSTLKDRMERTVNPERTDPMEATVITEMMAMMVHQASMEKMGETESMETMGLKDQLVRLDKCLAKDVGKSDLVWYS